MSLDRHKHVEITGPMLAQIEKVAATAVASSDIVVFTATAANTRPVQQKGSLFNGAVITKATLEEMAQVVNSGGQAVPIHTMHQAHTELPVGKVFEARVVSALDGHNELEVQFYLPKSESVLIEKINLGILDEVSIGLASKHLLCSQCGFDYMSPEALDAFAAWDQTCSEGHIIGRDGTHVVVSGVDLFSELSLVSRGASRNAKIHGHAKTETETQHRLAASGFPLGAMLLSASPQDQNKEPTVADPITTQFDAEVAFTALSAQLTALVAAITPPAPVVVDPNVAALAAAEAKNAELTTALAAATAVTTGALQADLPAGGVAAAAVTDAKMALQPTGSFKAPRK